jgi:hypothetical protein
MHNLVRNAPVARGARAAPRNASVIAENLSPISERADKFTGLFTIRTNKVSSFIKKHMGIFKKHMGIFRFAHVAPVPTHHPA